MSDNRGITFGEKADEAPAGDFANNRAYVIGINAYKNAIPQLRTAAADAERLAEVLRESHGYTVLTLTRNGDPTLTTLRDLLHKKLPQEVGPNDRVLIYFAGHGIALDGEDGPEGYLVPEDANREHRASFLPMTELSDALGQLPCRHLLLILDCCFAGAFRWSSTRDLSTLPSVIHQERYERYIKDPAWQVITSAAYDQTALDVLSGNTIGERIETADHSPFAAALFRALAGDADLFPRGKDGQAGGDGVITATELYLYLRECVETATLKARSRQTPGLWPLKKHDKGEYILLSPGHELNLPPAPELNEKNNPYRGLESFDEDHAQLFFGRSKFVDVLAERVQAQPLTIVLGASGTGKSSVVKAGLLPYLRFRKADTWHLLPPLRPGKSPLAALAALTLPGESNDPDAIASRLMAARSQAEALAHRVLSWATTTSPSARLLIVVDQFEELLTFCRDTTERDQFLAQLDRVLAACPDQLRVVLTLRSDFEPQFAHSALREEWLAARIVVPVMTLDEYREAIEGPASVKVLYFQGKASSQAFIDRLIGDVANTPGALPLLSFTLSELYRRYLARRGDDRSLREEDYDALGGVGGSLRNRADDIYNGLPDDDHRRTMHRMMMRMVSIEGGELARRRIPEGELIYESEAENRRVTELRRRLTEARLVVTGTDLDSQAYLEPAHDELIRGWDRLLHWSRKEAESMQLRTRLNPAAIAWRARGGGLWHADPRLPILQRELKSDGHWLNGVEAEFTRQSIARRRRQTTLVFLTATGIIVGLVIGLAAVRAQLVATQNQRALRYVQRGIAEFERQNPSGGLMAFHQVYKTSRDARISLFSRLLSDPLRDLNRSARGQITAWSGDLRPSLVHDAPVIRLVVSSNGRLLATATQDDYVHLWDLNGSIHLASLKHDAEVSDLAFSEDSSELYCVTRRGAAFVWDVERSRLLSEYPLGAEATALAISPDRRTLAVATVSGVVVCDLSAQDHKTQVLINGHRGHSVLFLSDSKQLLTACDDIGDQLWVVGTEQSPRTVSSDTSKKLLPGKDESYYLSFQFRPPVAGNLPGEVEYDSNCHTVTKINLSGDQFENQGPIVGGPGVKDIAWSYRAGKLAIVDGTVEFRSIDNPEQTADLKGRTVEFGGDVRCLAFTPDGDAVVTGSSTGICRLWYVRDPSSWGKETLERSNWPLALSASGLQLEKSNRKAVLAYGPDGKTLLRADRESSELEWRITVQNASASTTPHVISVGDSDVRCLTCSPSVSVVVSGHADGGVRFWDASTSRLRAKGQYDGRINALAASPAGQFVASAGEDGTVRIWDLATLREVASLPHGEPVQSLHFNDSGWMLATGSGASGSSLGAARLWDVRTRGPVWEPFPHGGPVTAVALSTDANLLATGTAQGADLSNPSAGMNQVSGRVRLWDTSAGVAIGPDLLSDNNTIVRAIVFNPNRTLTAVFGGLRVFQATIPLSPPLPDDPKIVESWVAVRTGQYVDAAGNSRPLSFSTWAEHAEFLARSAKTNAGR